MQMQVRARSNQHAGGCPLDHCTPSKTLKSSCKATHSRAVVRGVPFTRQTLPCVLHTAPPHRKLNRSKVLLHGVHILSEYPGATCTEARAGAMRVSVYHIYQPDPLVLGRLR